MSGPRKTPRHTRTGPGGARKRPPRKPAAPAGRARRGAASRPSPATTPPRATAAAEAIAPPPPAAAAEERLGELPGGYGEDALVALPRDPRTLFVYWDHAPATLRRASGGLEPPRLQLRLLCRRGPGWEPIRVVEVAPGSRAHYLHDLEPGGTYRAELVALDGGGAARPLGLPSGEVSLPPGGPSPVVDDRFVRVEWDRPLGAPLGPGHPRPGFSDQDRDALARLSGGRAGLAHGASLFGRSSSPSPGGVGER